jgi:hypothetical protein
MEVIGQLHTPATLSTGKRPHHPLNRMGGAQSKPGHFITEKHMQFIKKLISYAMAVALALTITVI